MPRFAHLHIRAFVATAVLAVVVCAPTTTAEAASSPAPVDYRPPVDAPITDPFRPPATPYGRGNRGIDYATALGQPVTAAAPGTVVFAGQVGFGRHVVVQHADGVRTSYSFLDDVAVRRAQRVAAGEAVGTSGTTLHVGARIGEVYVDPSQLFAGAPIRPHLVDDGDRGSSLDLPGRPSSPSAPRPPACTPRAEPGPPPSERRLAVLVGGLGSATGDAAIIRIDTTALGYEPADVSQFSYRADGGPYAPADTHQDIATAADYLARHIAARHAADPGAPIDVFAHSQGGLVTRAALARHDLDGVTTVVTLGTPHRGNALAAAGATVGLPSASIGQLAEGSTFVRGLPPHTNAAIRALSIAAATDPIVPAPSARWAGAANITVDLTGPPTILDHGRMTSDPAVTRELALAIAAHPPTCPSLVARYVNQLAGQLVDRTQRLASAWVLDRLPAGGRQVVGR